MNNVKDITPVRVLSLFNGYSGGMMALEMAGIPVEVYYSSEVDKYANKATQAIFPNTIQLGDVVALRQLLSLEVSSLEYLTTRNDLFDESYLVHLNHIIDIKTKGVDFVFGGSPCQGFSMAGKQLNFEDERSALFFEFVKIKEILNPRFWLLENVRMKKHIENAISKILGKKPYKINSNLVSAQNRYRLYWSNIRLTTIPKDQKILLKDILEPLENVDEKYYMKNIKNLNFKGLNINSKSKCLRSSRAVTATDKHNYDIVKIDLKGKPKKTQNKSSCLTGGGNSGGYHSDMDVLCCRQVGRHFVNGKRKDKKGAKCEQVLEPRNDQKTNCLSTIQKDNVIIQKSRGFNKGGLFENKSPTLTSNSFEHNNHVVQRKIIPVNPKLEDGKQTKMQDRIFDTDGISPCLTSFSNKLNILQRKNYLQVVRNGNQSQNDRIHFTENKMCALTASRTETKLNIIHNYIFRRLTPRECGRLQTIPENHIDIMLNCGVSDSQIYKMLGNGWTVAVIAFIFSKAKF